MCIGGYGSQSVDETVHTLLPWLTHVQLRRVVALGTASFNVLSDHVCSHMSVIPHTSVDAPVSTLGREAHSRVRGGVGSQQHYESLC